MKNAVLKILSILLVIVSVFSIYSIAYAEEETTPETEIIIDEYTTIAMTSSSIVIKGITATCSASLSAKSANSLKITMELQKKKSSGYETVKTWSGSKTSTSMILSGSRAINVLSTYRLKTTFKAGSESTVVYSYP